MPVSSACLFNIFNKFKSTLKCFAGSEPQCSVYINYVNKILPEVFRDFNILYLHSRAGIKLNQ